MHALARSPSLQMVIEGISEGRANLSRIKKLTEHLNTECNVDEADLTKFWNLSPDMFVVATTDGRFLEINDSWTRVLGWTKEELLSTSWFEFIHPNDVRPTREVVGHMTTNTLLRFHNRYRKKSGGYVCLEWSATQWHDGKCYAVARPVPSSCLTCPETASRFGFEVEPYGERK